MSITENGAEANLGDLRGQLADRLAVALMVVSVLLIWLNWPQDSFPFLGALPLLALAGLGWVVRKLVPVRSALARHLLVWSITAGLLAGMWLFPILWLPFLSFALIFVATLLIAGGGFLVAGFVAAEAAWLTYSAQRDYPLLALLITLALAVALAWQTVHTIYTALGWAWSTQQRADHLLGLARDRQQELNKTLKSLDLANAILRRTQHELVASRKEAEGARLMKQRFAANVSHELRTPLNILLGFSEVMHLSPEVYGEMTWPPEMQRDIYQMYRSARHLSEMIDDVLDLSRFEMVGFILEREPTALAPLLQDTVEIAQDLFRDQPVQLETEIDSHLPTLEIDRTRVRQVLLNLLSNAARLTEEGTVRVEARCKDGEVVVSVSDTGPGIPEDMLPHLFQEFYQLDRSLSRRHAGTGLGLAISKHFVEAHGGRIWVESPSALGSTCKKGPGATFTFTLPIPGQCVPWSRLHTQRPLDALPEVRPTVLVVDPDAVVASIVDRHLEMYDVVHVANSDRLEEEVALRHPRAVVWNKPPPDLEARDSLTGVPVPVIQCSLPSQAWIVDDLRVAGCLNKPVSGQHLLQRITALGDIDDVLIVDDDRSFCQLVERILEASGRRLKVRSAYGGKDGLHALRVETPDLLLLDLMMPEVDGFRVLEEMRQDAQLARVPVLLLTATSLVEDALAERRGQIVISRSDGLSPADVLRCLRAIIEVLEPRYDEGPVPQESLSGA